MSTRKRKPVALRAVRPNAGVQASYQRKLDALIDAMQAAVEAAIHTAYLRKPPRLAADEAPAEALRGVAARLGREWQQRFTDFANREGKRFTAQAAGHADRSLAEALRDAGFTVRFTMTPEARDVLAATMAEQVNLIRSIPAEYLTQVQGAVMRSVQTGRDLGALTTELQEQFGVTKRRAALIARTQNNMATASMVRVRQDALGITQAMWLHSAGGKVPRPTHVKNSGKLYDVKEGWLDPAINKRIWPGTEVNCFPGDMPISLSTEPLILWRAPFDGPMIHIHVGADLLKGTPNHPILTARGWIALGQLNDSDQIVCMVKDGRYVVDHNEHHAETTFHDLFEASRIVGVNVSRSGRGLHFYGDISNGDIDEIILSHDKLATHGHAGVFQNAGDFLFAKADRMSVSAGFGGVGQIASSDAPSLKGNLLAFAGVGLREPLAIGHAPIAHQTAPLEHVPDIAGSMTRHSQLLGDSGGPQAGIVEAFDLVPERVPVSPLVDRDADGAELFAQFVRIMANHGRDIFKFGSGLYELRRVSDKSVRDFSGHVFTMQTLTGYYGVGTASVQAKNCRCVSRSVIPGLPIH
jgi:Phage Mu protein F like protein